MVQMFYSLCKRQVSSVNSSLVDKLRSKAGGSNLRGELRSVGVATDAAGEWGLGGEGYRYGLARACGECRCRAAIGNRDFEVPVAANESNEARGGGSVVEGVAKP